MNIHITAHSHENLKNNIRILLPYFILFLWCWFLLITIFNHHAFIGGIDANFHMNSIYNDAMQIKTGNYNYFLSNYGFSQSGRIINALYGPGINYLLGWILLKCGSWTTFNMFTTFITLYIGVITMYLACLVFHMHRTTATICGMMSIVTHTIVTSWIGNQEFTGLGELLFPVVFIVGIRIVQSKQIHPIIIALTITFFLQLHLFTSLLAGITIAIYIISGFFISHFKKIYSLKTFLALLLTLGLNGNVLGAIQDVYSSNHLMPTFPQLKLQQLGMQWSNSTNGQGFLSRGFTTLGLAFSILVVVPILVILFSKWQHQDLKVTSLICLLSFILYSAYFPWNPLAKQYSWVAEIIQFPKRFSATFWIPFLLILGYIFDTMFYRAKANQVNVIWRLIPILPLIFIIWSWWQPNYNYLQWLPKTFYSSNVVRYQGVSLPLNKHPEEIREHTKSSNLKLLLNDYKKATPDYLPTLKAIHNKEYSNYPSYHEILKDFIQNSTWNGKTTNHGNHMMIRWKSKSNKATKVPVIKYNHTKLVYNHKEIHPTLDAIGVPTVKQKKGINHLKVNYQPGEFFYSVIIITIISWIITLVIISNKIYNCFKKGDPYEDQRYY